MKKTKDLKAGRTYIYKGIQNDESVRAKVIDFVPSLSTEGGTSARIKILSPQDIGKIMEYSDTGLCYFSTDDRFPEIWDECFKFGK